MKKTSKQMLAAMSASALILGGSLPLMGAETSNAAADEAVKIKSGIQDNTGVSKCQAGRTQGILTNQEPSVQDNTGAGYKKDPLKNQRPTLEDNTGQGFCGAGKEKTKILQNPTKN